MCGHDWCSMRISKEIAAFASGKDPAFQPARAAQRSPGPGDAGRELLRRRARMMPCHSEIEPDAERARVIKARVAAKLA
jgi:phosphomethylpyrimidine synthase